MQNKTHAYRKRPGWVLVCCCCHVSHLAIKHDAPRVVSDSTSAGYALQDIRGRFNKTPTNPPVRERGVANVPVRSRARRAFVGVGPLVFPGPVRGRGQRSWPGMAFGTCYHASLRWQPRRARLRQRRSSLMTYFLSEQPLSSRGDPCLRLVLVVARLSITRWITGLVAKSPILALAVSCASPHRANIEVPQRALNWNDPLTPWCKSTFRTPIFFSPLSNYVIDVFC